MNSIKEEFNDKKEQLDKSIDSGFNKAKRFGKKVLWAIMALVVVFIIGFFLWGNYTYSEGTRAGDLIKISKKGYLFKTYEGQLKLGGIDLENTKEGLSDTWSFSVLNEEIVSRLEKLQGQKVILRYKEINYSMPWQGDTDYFITGIESE